MQYRTTSDVKRNYFFIIIKQFFSATPVHMHTVLFLLSHYKVIGQD